MNITEINSLMCNCVTLTKFLNSSGSVHCLRFRLSSFSYMSIKESGFWLVAFIVSAKL